MVTALLTVLTVCVLQLGLALHVRNTLLDAAGEGARYAALADNTAASGADRTEDLLTAALGPAYAEHVSSRFEMYRGHEAAIVTVSATLPLFGLFGADRGLEVTAHAAVEELP